MKAEELRIGNLVMINNDETAYMVVAITHHKMKEVSRLVEDDLILLNHTTDHIFEMNIQDDNGQRVFGIPLTEEWLLKLGYRFYNGKITGTLCLDFGGKLDIDFYEGKIQVKSHYEEYGMYRPLNHIKYVHQLQNLYYALTGEELCLEA